MKRFIVGVITSLMLFQSSLFAQISTREMDIDMQLNAEAGGVAPPTGSAAVAPHPAAPEAFVFPPVSPAAKVVFGQTDKKARVYDLKGKVTWTKSGSPVEKKLRLNDVLEKGDAIQTEEKSSVSIAFDDSYMNAIHLPENTHAVIESIEPTDVRVENGAIYSAVNGLPQGGSWKITTPAAVAAVRGTLYLVRYQAANGTFYAATVDVPDDGKTSAIDIQEIAGSQHADVPEGKEITLTQGQTPSQDLVGDLDPESLQEILNFFEALIFERETQEEGYAPPTGNEPVDDSESGNENSEENSQPDLDPSDTGILTEDSQDQPLEAPLPVEEGPIVDDPNEEEKCELKEHKHREDWHDRGDRDDRWNDDRDDRNRRDRGDDRDDRWNDDRGRGNDDRDDRNRRDRGDDRDDRWNDDRGRGNDDRDDRNRRDRDGDRDDRWNDDRGRGDDDNHSDRDNHGHHEHHVDENHCEPTQNASEPGVE